MSRLLSALVLLLLNACDWPVGVPRPLEPTPACGDLYITEDETCDDGNDVTELCDYGELECMVCDSACQYVLGPTRYCGDGVLNSDDGEECDNANLNSDDAGCLAACVEATCGDGLLRMDLVEGIEGYEGCDDGEANNDLGACLSTCAVASCGDGFRRQDIASGEEGYEACDDGPDDSEICDAVDCSFAECGDGHVNIAAGEDCEDPDGNRITERCPEDEPDCLVCGRECTTVAGSYCGDGVVNDSYGEECDDGNDDNTDGCLSSCLLARCGDGFVRAGVEACDDANQVETDACRNDCVAAACGDGVLRLDLGIGEPGYEACDDGNVDNQDACLNQCRFASCGDGVHRVDLGPADPGYEACDDGGDSLRCRFDCQLSVCGDSYVNSAASETCDDGNSVREPCADNIPCQVCGEACTTVQGAICGDGVTDENNDEQCDDGDQVDTGNGCSADCRKNNICGDGIVEAIFEACDDGFTDACGDCNQDCTGSGSGYALADNGISPNYCGDGEICPQYEECDDNNDSNGDACLNNCDVASCGDGYIRTDVEPSDPLYEECDDGDESERCRADCKASTCGDGYINPAAGETCDDGNSIKEACPDNLPCEVCGDSCTVVAGAVCGDGIVDVLYGEQCDDGDTADTGNGCSESCRKNSVCGDGVIQTQFEICDDGFSDACGTCNADCSAAGTGFALPGNSGSLNYCGDGELCPEYEECDDGNREDNDGCPSGVGQCSFAICGDGFTRQDVAPGEEGFEACDDGGESADCKEDCTLSECGDGFTNESAGEECDDGNLVTEACPDDEPCIVCGSFCLNVPGARCGDGVLDELYGEECDDGNRLDDLNGCSANCRQNNVCGDGIVQSVFELCDDGYTDACGDCNADCSGLGTGYAIGGLNSANYCGDGSICEQFEECDDGNSDNDDGCVGACKLAVCGDGFTRSDLVEGELGFESCDDGDTEDSANGCDATCIRNDQCGDGVRQELFELCDDGYTDSCGDCNEDCSAQGTGHVCGDNEVCPQFEACDDGNNRIEICEYGGVADCLVCGDVCQEVPGIREFCGDGEVQPEYETCDLGVNGNSNFCPEGVVDCIVCSLRCLDEPGIPNCDDCDGGEGDCEGQPLTMYYLDIDFDGFGNPANSLETCFQPIGYVTNSLDCDDSKIMVNPEAIEICNGQDEDCDGIADNGLLGTQQDCFATSCLDILSDHLPPGSGTFWVGEDASSALELHCDFGTVAQGWGFLRTVSVINETELPWSNEQVRVLIDIEGLSAAGKMQSRGEDIRFFTTDSGLLSYWIGQRTDLGYEVWVTIPDLAAGATFEFHLAYGNPLTEARSMASYFDDFRADSSDDYTVVYDAGWAFNPEFVWESDRERFRAASFPDYFMMLKPEQLSLGRAVYVEIAGYWSANELDGIGPVVRSSTGAYYTAVVTDDYDGNQYTTGIDGIIRYTTTPSDHKQGERVGAVASDIAAQDGIRIGLAISGTSLEMFVDGVSVLGVSEPDIGQVDWAGFASISNIDGEYDYIWISPTVPPFAPLSVNSTAVTLIGAEATF